MAYTFALYPDDPHYYLGAAASGYRTLCDISTKGGKRNVRELRPPTRVIRERLTPHSPYRLCPMFAIKQIKTKDSLESNRFCLHFELSSLNVTRNFIR